MRLLKLISLLLLPATLLANPAKPEPADRLSIHARKIHLEQIREMKARAAYPDLFPPEKRAESDPPPPVCGTRRKRGEEEVEQVLTPKEAALFFKGDGQFVSENGTSYEDEHWSHGKRQGRDEVGRFRGRWFKSVVNAVGDAVVEASMPIYTKWRKSQGPESLFYITPVTAIRFKDIDDLVDELLDDPNFEELQYMAMRINRRWLEAAKTAYRA